MTFLVTLDLKPGQLEDAAWDEAHRVGRPDPAQAVREVARMVKPWIHYSQVKLVVDTDERTCRLYPVAHWTPVPGTQPG